MGGPSPATNVRLLAANGRIAFFADDRANGSELWKTDGTPAGTKLVRTFGYDIGRAATLDGALDLRGARRRVDDGPLAV